MKRRHRWHTTRLKLEFSRAYLNGEGAFKAIAKQHDISHALLTSGSILGAIQQGGLGRPVLHYEIGDSLGLSVGGGVIKKPGEIPPGLILDVLIIS